MQAVKIIEISDSEYLKGELENEVRHEFYDGQVYAMAGAGEKHNLISLNIALALKQKAKGSSCKTFMADMKLYIPELNRFYYPDLLLTCDPNDNHEYYKQSPCLIVEVLSPSTEKIDRREKLHAYQDIASLKEYLLVSQKNKMVELYHHNGQHWQYTLLKGDGDVLYLECLDLELTMAEIYDEVFV